MKKTEVQKVIDPNIGNINMTLQRDLFSWPTYIKAVTLYVFTKMDRGISQGST